MRSLLLRRSLGVPDAVTSRGLRPAMVLRIARLSGDDGDIGPEQRQDAGSALDAVDKGLAHGEFDLLLIGEDSPARVVAELLRGVQGYVDQARLHRYTEAAVDAVVSRARVTPVETPLAT